MSGLPSPDKQHTLADEIDAYVGPLAPHVANRTAAQLLRKASAVLRGMEPTAEVEAEWKQAVAMHGRDWEAIARRMARVASTLSTRSSTTRIEPGMVKAALIWGMHKGVVEAGGFERTEISGAFDLNTVADHLSAKLANPRSAIERAPNDTTPTKGS